MIKNKLLKFSLYTHRFGFLQGTKIILKLSTSRKGKIVSIRVPGVKHPIFLRAKTADEYTFRQIFINLEYDFEYSGIPRSIIDAGANIGLAAVFFANRYPQAKIYSLEPEKGNFEILTLNSNKYSTITAIQAGLWSKPAHLKIVDEGLGNWGFTVKEVNASEPGSIEATSVPALMRNHNLTEIDIAKIDIEGSEKEVLESEDSDQWLSACNTLVIELHDRMKPGTSAALFKTLLKFGVSTEQRGENMICKLHHQ